MPEPSWPAGTRARSDPRRPAANPVDAALVQRGMSLLANDLRLALRGLRRSPLFATVAIVSLALGVGANTAIFSLIDQVVLRAIPVRSPAELVMLYQEGPHNGSNSGPRMHSYPIYKDYQQRAEPLSEVICRRLDSASVSVDNQTERVQSELVSGNYFTMLGVRPALGRVFNSRDDDQAFQGHPVVVLSHDYWVRRFARDPGVVGRKILVNDYPMTIVGVSAAGFTGLDPVNSPDIRVPILMMPAMMPEFTWLRMDNRRARWVQVFARLKPGYTAASAQPALQRLFLEVRAHEMTLPAAATWSAYTRDQFMRGVLRLEHAATGYSSLRNEFSTALLVLMGMVGLVLLIACANVANLLIARGLARQREMAVRLSLGASRGMLIRQMLVESLVLAGAGGLAGLVFAAVLTRSLLSLVPSAGRPLAIEATPDLRVLLFTLVISVATGVVFGLVPAFRASRPDPWTTLKDTAGSIAGAAGSLVLRKGLVAAQVALGFLLLFGAGLFVKSLENLRTIDTGVALDNLVTFQVSPVLSGYDRTRGSLFYQQLLDRLRASSAVRSAAFTSVPILAGTEWDNTMSVEGHTPADGEDMQAYMNALSPGYFETMGIQLEEGRDFHAGDASDAPTAAIVNRRFADHFFPGRSAIGRRIGNGSGPNTRLNIEIVGVVSDSLYEGPREGVRRQVFRPRWGNQSATIYVRTTVASAAAYGLIRDTVRSLDAALPIYEMKTVQGQLDETLVSDRLVAMLSAGFGLLATMLASIGLYGVMAFVVARRRRELGIRLALGAGRGRVIWIVMKEVLWLVAVGLAVGVPAALAAGRFVSAELFGVQAFDPYVATFTGGVLIAVSFAAGMIPAHRASRIEPVQALRYE